jgi:adenylate kinase
MIQARYEIPSASPGSMLREEMANGTKLGIEADQLTSRGQLVPDATVNQLVGSWLEKRDSQFVFDGYPRSRGQADALETMLAKRRTPLEVVLSFEANLETLQGRVRNRVVCAKCRSNFSIGLHVADEETPCPRCGAQLVRRADDTPETLALRMKEYAVKTEPLIAYYTGRGLLRGVDATRTPDRVFASVVEIMEGA